MPLLRLHPLRLPFAALARQQFVRTSVTEPLTPYPTSNETKRPRDKLDRLLGSETPDIFDHDPPVAPAGFLPQQPHPLPNPKRSIAAAHALPTNEHFFLHVKSSNNNTILTLSDNAGKSRCWVSSGLCGFRKVQRSTYEAGYQCAVRMFGKIAEIKKNTPMMKLEVIFKGFGQGREAVFRALTTAEGDAIRDSVCRLRDVTPIKFGGTKSKKARRL